MTATQRITFLSCSTLCISLSVICSPPPPSGTSTSAKRNGSRWKARCRPQSSWPPTSSFSRSIAIFMETFSSWPSWTFRPQSTISPSSTCPNSRGYSDPWACLQSREWREAILPPIPSTGSSGPSQIPKNSWRGSLWSTQRRPR